MHRPDRNKRRLTDVSQTGVCQPTIPSLNGHRPARPDHRTGPCHLQTIRNISARGRSRSPATLRCATLRRDLDRRSIVPCRDGARRAQTGRRDRRIPGRATPRPESAARLLAQRWGESPLAGQVPPTGTWTCRHWSRPGSPARPSRPPPDRTQQVEFGAANGARDGNDLIQLGQGGLDQFRPAESTGLTGVAGVKMPGRGLGQVRQIDPPSHLHPIYQHPAAHSGSNKITGTREPSAIRLWWPFHAKYVSTSPDGP